MSIALLKAFSGLKPLVDPVLLDVTDATVAKNTRLISGAIEPLLGTTALKALTKTGVHTIWRYGTSTVETEYWLEFTEHCDVLRSPILDNQYGMVYWCGEEYPKYAPNSLVISGTSYPGGSYKLGIPKPAATIGMSGTAPSIAAQSETRTYVYTYVSAYGEEGQPSTACTPVVLDPTQPVNLDSMSVAPVGAYNITTKRIYRSSTVNSQAQFQFVAEIPVSQTTYTDTIAQSSLGEVLPSTLWSPPPAGMINMRNLGNGAMIGSVANTAYLSEPNLPHAWPNQYPTDWTIVGIGVYGQTAILLTDSHPYALTGVDPAAMSISQLNLEQACLSRESVVDASDSVMYASPDGLVGIDANGMTILTKQLFTRKQWQAYNPSSMIAAIYDNKYIAAYTTTAGVNGLLVLDFSGQGAVCVECDINLTYPITAIYADTRTDTLYFAQNGNIVRYDRGSALTYTWCSKTFRTPYPLNMTVGQVLAEAYPVTMKVYADGVLKATKSVANKEIFRLPGGFRALDWQIELSGTAKITQACIATSGEEIRKS